MDIEDMKKQWQKPIMCKEKKEPLDSYEILKLKMKNPHLSHKQIAQKLGYDLNRIIDLSSRYYHQARVNAYLQDEMKQLTPQLRHATAQSIKNFTQRIDDQQKLHNKHNQILQLNQEEILENLKQGIHPTTEQHKEYLNNYQQLNNNNESESKSLSEFTKSVNQVTNGDITDHDTTLGVKTLVQALKENRDAFNE